MFIFMPSPPTRIATVSLYTYAPVEPGERRLLRLTLAQPVVLVPGDRFVLRQASPAATIGGGRVLDAHPLHSLRKATRLAWLEKLQDAPIEQQLLLRVDRRGNAGIEYRDLALEMGLQREALQRFAKPMIERGTLIEISTELLITPEHIQAITESVITCMRSDTLQAGLKRSEVRSQLRLSAQVVDFVLSQLATSGKLTVAGERFYNVRADASAPQLNPRHSPPSQTRSDQPGSQRRSPPKLPPASISPMPTCAGT